MNICGGVRPAASLPHLNGGRQENNRGNVIHLCVQRAMHASDATRSEQAQV